MYDSLSFHYFLIDISLCFHKNKIVAAGVIPVLLKLSNWSGGWGQRLAAQEAEEEELYLAEQTKQNNQEEEELMKALAMSMEQDNKVRI